MFATAPRGISRGATADGEVEHVNRQVVEYFGRTLDELKHWGTSDAEHLHTIGIPPSTLESKIKQLGIEQRRFTSPYRD